MKTAQKYSYKNIQDYTRNDIKSDLKVNINKWIKQNETKIKQYADGIKRLANNFYEIVRLHKDKAPKLNEFIKRKESLQVPNKIKVYLEAYKSEINAIKAKEKAKQSISDNPDHDRATKMLVEIEGIFKMYCNEDSNDFPKIVELTNEFDTKIIDACAIMQEQNNKIIELEEEFQKNSKQLEDQSLMKTWYKEEKKKCEDLEAELKQIKSQNEVDIVDLKEQLENKEKLIKELKTDNERINTENKDIENKLEALEAQVKELNDQKIASENSIETLESELSRMKKEQEYLSKLESENKSLNSHIQNLESQLSEYTTNTSSVSEIAKLSRKSKETEKQKNIAEYELKQAKKDIQTLKQEIAQMSDYKEGDQTIKDQQEQLQKEMEDIDKENKELKDQIILLQNKQGAMEIGEDEGATQNSPKDNFEKTINGLSSKLKECKQRSDELQDKLKQFEDKEITVEKFTEQSEQIEALKNHLNQSKKELDAMETQLKASLETNNALKEKNKTLQENLDAMKKEEDQNYGAVAQEELKENETENLSEHIASENQYYLPDGSTVAVKVNRSASKSVNLNNLGFYQNKRAEKESKQGIEIEEITKDYSEKLKKYEEEEKSSQEKIKQLTEELDEEKATKKEQLEEKNQNIQELNQKLAEMETKIAERETEITERKTQIAEKKKDIEDQQNEIKRLNDDINKLDKDKQESQKNLVAQKSINKKILEESEKHKAKSEKKINKLSQRIVQLKAKLNKYTENLQKSSTSYSKHLKISKNLRQSLISKEQKYTDLKKTTRRVMNQLEQVRLMREKDIQEYSKLKEEYINLKQDFITLFEKDKADTADFNKMRSCFENFVRGVGEKHKSLCEAFEDIISENIRISNEFKRDTETKIESYNQEIAKRWRNNSTLNLQNIKFIDSLKNLIRTINENSEDNIKYSLKNVVSLSVEVKEELKTLKDKYPSIGEGYETFLLQNKEKLNKIKQEMTTQEDQIHHTNIDIRNHNKGIRAEVQQKKEELESDIDILKNKLSALQFIINQVDEKFNQSQLLEQEMRERNTDNTDQIKKELKHKN